MMKNSGLLKWKNAKNANKNGIELNNMKKSIMQQLNEKIYCNANKNWLHPPEALQGGHIVYLVKFLGSTEASQAKGIEVVKEAIQKLKFCQQIKKSEGTKTPKVELTISVDGVAIQQPKSKKIMFQYPLHQISYCADDKAEKRFFSFIAKEGDREAHTCFVFVSDKLAEEITLTIGQAFDLAYRRFLETSNREVELRRQIIALQHQLVSVQSENSTLKGRLSQVATIKNRDDVEKYMKENGISDLLFINGEQSVEQPIIHSNGHHQAEDIMSTVDLPPVPPRNTNRSNSQEIDDLLSANDASDDDFDPRAEELKDSPGSNRDPIITNGFHSPPYTNGYGMDDDFDPRANESEDIKLFDTQNSFENQSPSLDLKGLSPVPLLVPPPPRTARPQDKNSSNGNADPFSLPPGTDLLAEFIEMKVGFSRGLSFGSADADFTLDSLDPLKN